MAEVKSYLKLALQSVNQRGNEFELINQCKTLFSFPEDVSLFLPSFRILKGNRIFHTVFSKAEFLLISHNIPFYCFLIFMKISFYQLSTYTTVLVQVEAMVYHTFKSSVTSCCRTQAYQTGPCFHNVGASYTVETRTVVWCIGFSELLLSTHYFCHCFVICLSTEKSSASVSYKPDSVYKNLKPYSREVLYSVDFQ